MNSSRGHSTAYKEMVDRVFGRLCKVATKSGIESLSFREQAVVLPLWANGYIMNGGFRYWFEGAFWKDGRDLTPLLADTFAFLGFPEAAKACRDAMHFFPDGALRIGPSGTNVYMNECAEELLEARFRPLDRTLWATEERGRLARAVAKVIRERNLDKLR
ncbi:MAG TPA: hypothetical protein PK280_14115 [Planctomycetota bacterium]|nr:hypothetical protein [Planctomycetota bacterium]